MNLRIVVVGFLLSHFAFLQSSHSQTWRELYHEADSVKKIGYGAAMPHALDLAKHALVKAEQEFGASDSNVANILDLCAEVLLDPSVWRPSEAQSCAERSLEINKKIFGPDHPKVANSLALLAFTGSYRKNPQEAMILLERARSILERAGGAQTKEYASLLHNIAFSAQSTGDFTHAGSMFSKALDLYRQVLPPEDPEIAATLTMFAVNYWNLGLFHEAEPLLREALQVWQKNYGEESMQSAICIGNLSQHYSLQGRFAESEVLDKRCLAICERELPANDPFLGAMLMGTGDMLMSLHKYDEAVDTLTRAMKIYERVTEVQERISWATRLIGECHFEQHNYAQAELDFRRAIALGDSLLPGSSARGSEALLALARTYAREKRFEIADSIFGRILSIRQERLGSDNLNVADVLDAYSECARLKGDVSKSLELSRRAVDIRANNFVINARMMSERDARSYAQFLRHSVDAYLSGFVDARITDSSAIGHTAGIILSTKGQTTEQAVLRQQSLVKANDSATLALAENYRYTRFKLSQSYVGGLHEKDTEGFRRRVDSLETVSNDLEAALARRGARSILADRGFRLNPKDIAACLPPQSALVEYLKYDYVSLDPDTLLPRYIALVVSAGGKIEIVDLGAAEKTDRTVELYQKHFNDIAQRGQSVEVHDEVAYRAVSRNLIDLIWQKCEPLLRGSGVVFVAPDAGLNLVSFSTLCGADGRYLIEKYALHYLSAGRDVLRSDLTQPTPTGCFAFGDPDFDASCAERISAPLQIAENVPRVEVYQLRNVRPGCASFSDLVVPRLHGTRTEVEAIGQFWSERNSRENIQVLVGARASEEAFKKISGGKRVIHLATHGYYLEAGCLTVAGEKNVIGENPLLQSGLLLAGANLHGKGAREAGGEDGILTALEVSAMNLQGTDLVVLSACQTGLGRVEQGEGVYGLRRAFQMAGARTVVSSLWQVPDMESMRFMKSLYSMNSQTYPELMRKVALKRISEARLRGRPTHPFTWGAFVATGEWKNRSKGSTE
jgi:CHAT domain-containing protein